MWIILLALAIFFTLIIGLAMSSEHEKEIQKEAAIEERMEVVRKKVASIQKIYQDMKRDDGCCRLFSECRAKIEAYGASLDALHITFDAVEFWLYPEKDAKSWEVETGQAQKHRVKFSEFLSNGLSDDGRAALGYWLVTEISVITYNRSTKDIYSIYNKKYFEHGGSCLDVCERMESLFCKKPS